MYEEPPTKGEQESVPPDITHLSPEESLRGYQLGPDEAVMIDSSTLQASGQLPKYVEPALHDWAIEEGVSETIHGRSVADVAVGGSDDMVEATVLELEPQKYALALMKVDPRDKDRRLFSVAYDLEPGQMVSIGRGEVGQENLPDTVSGDHCAIGLDENNNLMIENHQPTNYTAVRTHNYSQQAELAA